MTELTAKGREENKMWSTCIYWNTPLKQVVTDAQLMLSLEQQSG
jgi:hypothetical protein